MSNPTKVWCILETPKQPTIMTGTDVTVYTNKVNAFDDFVDRCNDMRSRDNITVLVEPKFDGNGTAVFETDANTIILTESRLHTSYVPLTEEQLNEPVATVGEVVAAGLLTQEQADAIVESKKEDK